MGELIVSGVRETVRSSDGVEIGTVTAGEGPPLLLVHGGMRSAAGWAPLWPLLVDRYRVTAMDRRGRGMSGDAPTYAFDQEYEDVAAVARHLGSVDVLAHSIGAVFALGAAARGAPIRRLVLCEPPGPPTISDAWIERASARMAAGEPGRALVEFLVEIIGLDQATIVAMRGTPVAENALEVFTATFRREGVLLRALDLAELHAGRHRARPVPAGRPQPRVGVHRHPHPGRGAARLDGDGRRGPRPRLRRLRARGRPRGPGAPVSRVAAIHDRSEHDVGVDQIPKRPVLAAFFARTTNGACPRRHLRDRRRLAAPDRRQEACLVSQKILSIWAIWSSRAWPVAGSLEPLVPLAPAALVALLNSSCSSGYFSKCGGLK